VSSIPRQEIRLQIPESYRLLTLVRAPRFDRLYPTCMQTGRQGHVHSIVTLTPDLVDSIDPLSTRRFIHSSKPARILPTVDDVTRGAKSRACDVTRSPFLTPG